MWWNQFHAHKFHTYTLKQAMTPIISTPFVEAARKVNLLWRWDYARQVHKVPCTYISQRYEMDIFPLRCKALRCPLDLSRQNSLMRWHFKVTSQYKLHWTTKIIHSDYSITKRPITRNPQANSVQKGYTKWEHGPDPASGFLTRRREWSLEWHSCGYLVYHTSYYHTSTQAIPVQLAFW